MSTHILLTISLILFQVICNIFTPFPTGTQYNQVNQSPAPFAYISWTQPLSFLSVHLSKSHSFLEKPFPTAPSLLLPNASCTPSHKSYHIHCVVLYSLTSYSILMEFLIGLCVCVLCFLLDCNLLVGRDHIFYSSSLLLYNVRCSKLDRDIWSTYWWLSTTYSIPEEP